MTQSLGRRYGTDDSGWNDDVLRATGREERLVLNGFKPPLLLRVNPTIGLMGFNDGSHPAIGYRDAQQLKGDAKNAIKVEY
jgi:hypothetical protein